MDLMNQLISEISEVANSKIGYNWELYTYLFDDGTYLIRAVSWEKTGEKYIIEVIRYKWNKDYVVYKKIKSNEKPSYQGKEKTEISFGGPNDTVIDCSQLKSIETDIDRIENNIDHPLVSPNNDGN
jgi:hypothetical protein